MSEPPDKGAKSGGTEPRSDGNGDGFHPDFNRREEVHGRRPGDRMVRIPRNPLFQSVAPGRLVPRPRAVEPQGGFARHWWRLTRFMFGKPIPTEREAFERLTKVKALAVLSSDALSSVAYSVEATMRVLILAGIGALSLTMPLTIVIVVLLFIVATSYQQTIQAYPSGGGSYVVAHENLGVMPGLIAGAALLVGYILTAAVSIAAGVDALVSAYPWLADFNLAIATGAIVLLTLMNMRGVRESGSVFAVPTYVFLVSMFTVLAIGLWKVNTGGIVYVPPDPGPQAGTEALSWFLILSAFSKGCSAMTGTEAIANAVPAFQPPESRNARITLMTMAGLLGTMVLGIAFLITAIGMVPAADTHETVLSQLTRLIVGDSWFFYLVQFATALLLFLAANTSYTGFPWLLNVMARDSYVPHWFGLRGGRLAFSFGISALSLLSVILILAFQGSVESLLPLYALGVFLAFTLSQAGMTVHWLRGKAANWQRGAFINGLGAVSTGFTTIIIVLTKFLDGAWLVVIVVPLLVTLFMFIHRHYLLVSEQLKRPSAVTWNVDRPTVVIPVAQINMVVRQALEFARVIAERIVAVHVATDEAEAELVKKQWSELAPDVPIVVIDSPYRLLIPPLVSYIDALRGMEPHRPLIVVLPELVPRSWWEQLLHNQTALRLKAALLFRQGVMVLSVPYQLADKPTAGSGELDSPE